MIAKKSDTQKKLPVLLAAGAMFAPLLNPIVAQAQPPAHAPATGYQKNDKKNANQRRDSLTLTGVVTRNLAGNEFSFRANDGRTFRVVTRNAEPRWLSVGDRVEVRGWRDGDLLIAESVRAMSNTGDTSANQGEHLTLTGVVTQLRSGNDFYLRASDGRTFRVSPRGSRPARVVVNDRVEVRGRRDRAERDVIHADSVREISATGNAGNQADRIFLTGAITRMLSGNDFTLRASDGRTYTVRSRDGISKWMVPGAQIEVRGWRNPKPSIPDFIQADSVRLVQEQENNFGQRADLTGTVVRLHSPTRMDLRAEDGRTYGVTYVRALPSSVSVGDRVRVVGRTTSTSGVAADSIGIINDRNAAAKSSTGKNGASVNFPGRVETVKNNGLIRNLRVRGDNGQVYTVQYRNLQTFKVGDRVRVIGTFNNGAVNASSVTML